MVRMAPAALAKRMVADAILTIFQAEQNLLGKWKRFTIGKYKVLERIGTGGMGQVFLCEHKLMRRRVALRSEERRVGKECRSRRWPEPEKKKEDTNEKDDVLLIAENNA